MRRAWLVILIVFLSGFAEGVFASPPTAILTSSSSVNLKTGESTTATFSVSNDNDFCGVTAYYSVDSTSYSNIIGRIDAKTSKSVNIVVSAPPIGSGSGSTQRRIYIKIVTDSSFWCNGEIYSPALTLNINYDDSEFQNAKSNANTAINSANNAISTASSSISNAQNAITAAKNIGADVSNAEVKLTSAQTAYQNAQSKLTSAQNSFNQNTKQGFDLATQYANDATSYANSAKADADSAYALAIQAKQIILALKKDAETALNNAKKAVDTTYTLIDTVQKLISESKNIGLDVTSVQPTLDAASSKLTDAASKYKDAVSQFNALKYETAKEYAKQAETYANEASTNARNAESVTIQLKEKLASEKGQAELKLASAQTTYNNVVSTVDQTNKIISRASEMKIDISSFSKDLEKVTSTLIDAKAEIGKAKSRFDNKEYAESKKSSSASLEITEKHVTILQNIQYNVALAAKEVITKRHSTVTSSYSSALKTVEDTKAEMTGDIYSSRKDKLGKAKANLDECSNLISKGNSYLEAKDYYDAVSLYRSAYSQLDGAESISTSIKTSVATERAGIIQKIVDFIKGIFKSIFG